MFKSKGFGSTTSDASNNPKLFSFENRTHLLNNPNCPPHSLYGDDKFPEKYEDCMKNISVDYVFDKIMEKYGKKK